MTDVHRCIIVTDATVDSARNLADCVSVRGEGMFTTALSPTGSSPATHWISSGFIALQFANLLNNANGFYAAAQYGADMQGKELVATLEDAQAVLAQADVSEDNPFDALSRLGLVLVTQ